MDPGFSVESSESTLSFICFSRSEWGIAEDCGGKPACFTKNLLLFLLFRRAQSKTASFMFTGDFIGSLKIFSHLEKTGHRQRWPCLAKEQVRIVFFRCDEIGCTL